MGSVEDIDDQRNCYCKTSVLDNVICISDREEGEIVEANDLEDVSDISSEEEFLLRQRIQILENYNDALERKEAKRRSVTTESSQLGKIISISLSDISASDSEVKTKKKVNHNEKNKNDSSKKAQSQRKVIPRRDRSHNVRKNRHKIPYQLNSGNKKCIRKKNKTTRSVSESSAESEKEKYEKRRKLREAICKPKHKNDNSSLKLRLVSMLHKETNKKDNDTSKEIYETITSTVENQVNLESKPTYEEKEIIQNAIYSTPNLPSESKENSSDDDIEALRQLALQTKCKQNKGSMQIDIINKAPENACNNVIDDIDSDTAELRLYALKTAILKKAMERKKRKKSIAKMKSQSSFVTRTSLGSEFEIIEEDFVKNIDNQRIDNKNDSTDVESVDMDIDNPSNDESTKIDSNLIEVFDNSNSNEIEKYKMMFHGNEVYDELSFGQNDHKLYQYNVYANSFITDIPSGRNEKMDEDIEEDEDILRAKLLTSLSNNIKISKAKKEKSVTVHSTAPTVPSPPPTTNLVIKLGDSDSGTDCESTKNLTEMHKRLTDQSEFQKSLDLFLNSARRAAENKTTVKNQSDENIVTALKYSPMAVKHLPRADQQEYRRLVVRMAELEKVKQARQIALIKTSNGNNSIQIKLTQGATPYYHNHDQKWGYNATLLNQIIKDNTNTSSNLDVHIDQSREVLKKATDNVLNLRQEVAQQLQTLKMAARQFRLSKRDLLVKQHALTLAKNTLITRQLVHRSLLKRSMMQTMNNIPIQRNHNNMTIDNSKGTSLKIMKKQIVVDNKPSAQQTNTYKNNASNSIRVKEINNLSKTVDNKISTSSKVINNQTVVDGKLNAKQINLFKKNVSNSIRIEVINDLSKSLILNDTNKNIKNIAGDNTTLSCPLQAVVENIGAQADTVTNDEMESDYQSPLQYKITNSPAKKQLHKGSRGLWEEAATHFELMAARGQHYKDNNIIIAK